MNIKPYRDYDEHEVINGYFSLNTATGSKGTFVSVTTFNPDSWQEFAGGAGSYARGVNGVFSSRVHTTAKVAAAAAGSDASVLGMLLYDVKETDENGFPLLISNADKSKQLQCVNSGQPVPIAVRGIFEINGFSGTPGPMSGAAIGNDAGTLKVVGRDVTPRVGKFLSQTGADGFAIFKLEL